MPTLKTYDVWLTRKIIMRERIAVTVDAINARNARRGAREVIEADPERWHDADVIDATDPDYGPARVDQVEVQQ